VAAIVGYSYAEGRLLQYRSLYGRAKEAQSNVYYHQKQSRGYPQFQHMAQAEVGAIVAEAKRIDVGLHRERQALCLEVMLYSASAFLTCLVLFRIRASATQADATPADVSHP